MESIYGESINSDYNVQINMQDNSRADAQDVQQNHRKREKHAVKLVEKEALIWDLTHEFHSRDIPREMKQM